MNERIKELAEQAYGIDDAKPLHPSALVALDAFAKLIVRECLDNMENCDGDLDFAIWKTKQDFGVKQ